MEYKKKQLSLLLMMLFIILFFIFSFSSLAQIPGDFNEDGKVDFEDLMIFALAYGSTPSSSHWNASCDLHPDDKIDFEDLMIFAMNYGETEQEVASWTLLVYMCGDNDLDYYAWDDLREMESIGSTDEVNIIVQLDPSAYRSCDGTYRYHVTGVERGISYPLYPEDIVQVLPEKNMADPAVLTDFISWSMDNYSAEKYLLVLWNHGTGWRREYIPTKGIIYDDSSGDYMTIAELAQALENIPQSIDILGFDACLMQMIEVAYEISKISNAPKYMVASQADEWGYGWPYDDLAAHLISNPSMDELTLAKTIVDDYTNNCGKTGTLSVLDFSSFDSNMIEAINSFSNALMNSDYQSEIADARTLSLSYSLFYNSKDFFDFSQRIYDTVPDCQNEAQEIMNQLDNLIPYEANTGGAVASSHGLSIYLPGSPDNYDNNYDFLQFAINTKWDEFLKYKHEPLTPGGLAYNWYYWPYSSQGFNEFDVDLTIDIDPGEESYYYWAHQFPFKDGDGGYMGLQTNGYISGLGWVGKMAIFSIWDALDAEAGPGAYCEEFGGEGVGWSCRKQFNWVEGHTYGLRVKLEGLDGQQNKWWGAYIIDKTVSEDTFLGKILVPGDWKGLGGWGWSVVWVEYYGEVNGCGAIPHAKVRFEQPMADNVHAPESVEPEYGKRCTNSNITIIGNTGVIFETGKP